jgi:hypothetical protein
MEASTLNSLQQQLNRLEQSSDATAKKQEKFARETKQQLARILQAIGALKGCRAADTACELNVFGSIESASQVQHRHQCARVSDDETPILARNEVLDTVFSFVGIGDYYYVACVCRNWRGRYMTFCHKTPERWTQKARPPYTSCSSIVMTAARLQLALDNGLTVAQLQAADHLALSDAIVNNSLEPVEAITLARLYGLAWNTSLTEYAACFKKYELLKWLLKCGCPKDVEAIIEDVREMDYLKHTQQLYAITNPWPAEQMSDMMSNAGSYSDLDTVKWWRAQGAAWPTSFYNTKDSPCANCWSLRCVRWAIANGSTWLEWRCQDLAPEHYDCDSGDVEHSDETCFPACDRKHAAELFKWAHANGCACTCGEAAAV